MMLYSYTYNFFFFYIKLKILVIYEKKKKKKKSIRPKFQKQAENRFGLVVFLFNGISTFMGYLMPKSPF